MQDLDRRAVEWLSGLDWPIVTPLMKGLTYAGGAAIIWIALGLVLAVRQRRPLVLVVLVVAERVSAVLDGILKDAIGRERPPVADPNVHALIPVPHDSSMPSGHAMMAFTGAVFLAAVAPRFRWWFFALATGHRDLARLPRRALPERRDRGRRSRCGDRSRVRTGARVERAGARRVAGAAAGAAPE